MSIGDRWRLSSEYRRSLEITGYLEERIGDHWRLRGEIEDHWRLSSEYRRSLETQQ